MSSSETIRVLIADDHPVVRAGIISMLRKEPDIHVAGEINDGEQVERLSIEAVPDVLVLDINMPGLDPVGTVRRLEEEYPELRILVLTAYDDEAYVTSLLSAGVAGYLLKEEAPETLIAAIRAVAEGGSWLSQRIARQLARKAIAQPDTAAVEPLTGRESEVLRLLAMGLGNADIAEKLFITKRTVQNHVSSIYGKLALGSRAEAVLYAIRHGLVDISEIDGP